jgi:GNAT superfamily N-acetyltransferase
MSTALFCGSEAERLGDAIEAAAMCDLYAAAPPEMRMQSAVFGAVTALIAPTLPITFFNRVIGLGNETPATAADIERVSGLFEAAGIGSYWIHLVPSARPAELAELLQQRGFAPPPRRSWAKFLRGTEAPPSPRTELRIREATPADAAAVANVVCTAFGMPPSIAPWFGALVGRPKWHVLVAEDRERVVATASLFVDADMAWLGVGGTLADRRGQGAHKALIAKRIAAAVDFGCRVIATETGEPIQGEPNPSLANLRRAGFVQVCSRLNFEAPRPVK